MNFVKRANLKEQYKNYLFAINGYVGLTDREIDILSLILFYNTGDETVLNRDSRKTIREELGCRDLNLNNHIANLKSKGVLVQTVDGVKVNDQIVPELVNNEISVTFKFMIDA